MTARPSPTPQPDAPPSGAGPAPRTLELPVVVLGDSQAASQKPLLRMLPGRVAVAWVLYPCYIVVIVAGSLIVNFAIDTDEWAPPVVAVACTLLYIWNWVYGVAYRYRRRVLKYLSLIGALGLGCALAALSWERGQPQLVAVAGTLVERPLVASLQWATWLLLVNPVLLVLHALFLGRGYRAKRYRIPAREASPDGARTS